MVVVVVRKMVVMDVKWCIVFFDFGWSLFEIMGIVILEVGN